MPQRGSHAGGETEFDGELDFEIAPELAQARTPPPDFYRSQRVHDAVRSRVFRTNYQIVNPAGALPQRGRAQQFTLCPAGGRERVLVTHDTSGVQRVLSATCPHRGAEVEAHDCAVAALRCPYHGRRFAADGRMLEAPGFDASSFDPNDEGLRELDAFSWGPFLFAAPGSFDTERKRAVVQALARLGPAPSDLRHAADENRFFDVQASWALYVDNYLEGLHVPFVHPRLESKLEASSYRVELLEAAVLQSALPADGEAALPPGEDGRADAARWLWIFPATMINVYPWGLSINVVEATGPETCRVHYSSWHRDSALRQSGAGAQLDEVEREDERVVESVARGLRSASARRGRYAPEEAGVHHFHRLLVAALAAGL